MVSEPMQQLAQKLKDGTMRILEVNTPAPMPGRLLIQNHYSLISAGTEMSTVKAARSSLVEKARQRPQQLKQVIDVLRQQGPVQTYRAVMKKLDAYSPLGYSCVGQVLESPFDCEEYGIRRGDWVACGGLTASHAEIVSVPEKLCVKLNPDTDMRQAAYNTLGAIAMQGVRQADMRLGEVCAVVGLGLLGQLTCSLLKASGVRVIGIDINPGIVDIAKKNCTDLALPRDTPGIENKIAEFTGGIGCDAVIITAATDSLDPINFAGAIARKKASVIVVGAVPTGFDREPYYYKKELELKMSCSYGPGRYDPNYEDKGLDYPPSYVRWTEKRNMEAFQELIYNGKIDISYLSTHTFKLEEAPDAYDMMMSKSEPFLGILISYDPAHDLNEKPLFLKEVSKAKQQPQASRLQAGQVGIGFVGAGSYAQSHLLPNIPAGDKMCLKGVMTSSGTSSRSVAERYSFEFSTGEIDKLLTHPEVDTLFITTRHDSHAQYVVDALKAGKNVFVEKPLCLAGDQLEEIVSLILPKTEESTESEQPVAPSSSPILMVGYNRRFTGFARELRGMIGSGPATMLYRVNAGAIPKDSWIQDKEIGGGRIIGEVCHFVDFFTYINGSLPITVYATVMEDAQGSWDTVNVALRYANGSIGTIIYSANGDKSLPKERVEVSAHGISMVIDDFKTMTTYAKGKPSMKKLISQDKGQKQQVASFLDAVAGGKQPPVPYAELFNTSWVTFQIIESIRSGYAIRLN